MMRIFFDRRKNYIRSQQLNFAHHMVSVKVDASIEQKHFTVIEIDENRFKNSPSTYISAKNRHHIVPTLDCTF